MGIDGRSLGLLRSSSAEGVALSLHRVAAGMSNNHWVPPMHRYRDKGRHRGIDRLKADLSNGTVRSDELSEYVGISGPVHSLDGWSLLGRAIHCLLRGDSYSAIHMAYYAELRAALAILASQGIGIFNGPHCIIDLTGCCKIVKPMDERGKPLGNHRWTWEVFRWWSQEPRAIELLRKGIRPNGNSLGTWIDEMSKARFALTGIGARWLELWGIDIGRYFADREARNAASYWPNTINSWESRTFVEDYKAVSSIWLPLEPTSDARFSELDRHLLRILLFDGYFGATGHKATSMAGRKGFKAEVENLLQNMGMNDSAKFLWRKFLTDLEGIEEPAVIKMASGKAKVGAASHVVEVMSRATMLLRLATGASAALLSEAGIEREHLRFWIQAVGAGRGIWQTQKPPEDLIELWDDVAYELEQLDGRFDGTDPSAQEIWTDHSRGLAILGECERVALWGLGL